MDRSLCVLRGLRGSALCAVAVLLSLVLFVPSVARAQAVTGTLLGNVTDSSGAAVPGATVNLVEVQTNIKRSATTNDVGFYIFASLLNGTYIVETELQGFRKVVRNGRPGRVNTTMRVDVKLEVGQTERGRERHGRVAACFRPIAPIRAA